jgi:hypothetical protein
VVTATVTGVTSGAEAKGAALEPVRLGERTHAEVAGVGESEVPVARSELLEMGADPQVGEAGERPLEAQARADLDPAAVERHVKDGSQHARHPFSVGRPRCVRIPWHGALVIGW